MPASTARCTARKTLSAGSSRIVAEKRRVEALAENGGAHEYGALVRVETNRALAQRGLQRQRRVRCQIHAAGLGGDVRQLLGEERIALGEHFDARDGRCRNRDAGRVTRHDRAYLVAMQSAQTYALDAPARDEMPKRGERRIDGVVDAQRRNQQDARAGEVRHEMLEQFQRRRIGPL